MSLIEMAKNKDSEAFEQLMRPCIQKMYRIAYSILRNDEDAADAIQETTFLCWQKISQVRNEEFFETWLIRILINQCNNILKNRKKVIYTDEFSDACYEDDYSTCEWKSVIKGMNDKYRLVMELFYVDGYSTKEIAQILCITEMSVRKRLSRGRKQLEDMFKDKQ